MSDVVTSTTLDSWDKDVMQSPNIVMVDFWAAW